MPMGKIYLSARRTAPKRRRGRPSKKRAYKAKTNVNHTGGSYVSKGYTSNLNSLCNLGPFPSRKTCWMKYCRASNQTTTTPAPPFQIELNSTYDPEYTVGGHQPLYRDILSSIYDNYKVYQVIVEFTIVCRTPNACGFMGLHIQAGDATNYPTTPERLIEKPGVRWRYLSPGQTGKLKCRYKMSDIFGITDNQYHSIREYGAGAGASPSAGGIQYGAILTPMFCNADGSTSTDFSYSIVLYQKVTWRNIDYEAQN